MSTIFITEKHSVAQDYQRVLGIKGGVNQGYIEGRSPVLDANVIITWAVGHLVGICPPELQNEDWKEWKTDTLPMIPKNFKYAVLRNKDPKKDTSKQFAVIKSLYTRDDIDCIYYAGDSGREGIYIQALIRNQIFKTKPKCDEKVVWIDSFTDEAIKGGIRNAKPYSDYEAMIESGYSRAMDDWLIGMNLSRAFSLTSGGYKNLIPVGRVMTPTLAMVVNRQNEIDNFVKTDYFGIKADDFANWKAIEGSRFFESDDLYNESGFLKKADAERLADEFNKDKRLTVSNVKVTKKTEHAPYLFNLADLQAFCSKKFKISPAKTLEVAQFLYEKKYTTYPRTDCRFLSTAVQKELASKGYKIPNRYVNDKKITDHYAIIPTLQGDADKLDGLEKSVYEAIVKRFMDTMKPPFLYDAVAVQYIHSNNEKFFENFRIVTQLGFKEKPSEDDKDEKDEKDDKEEEKYSSKAIPKKGDVVNVEDFHTYDMETKPPTAYTTGSLILAMEKAGKLIEDEELREQIKTCGIGTSATRANIIEKLEKCNFITIDKKQKVAPTDRGKQVIAIIAKYDETLVSPVKTAEMEQQLQAISETTLTQTEHSIEINAYLKETVKNILENNKDKIASSDANGKSHEPLPECPHCGGILAHGKYGIYCKGICGASLTKVYGHELTENQIRSLLAGKEISFTVKGRKTNVYPKLVEHVWNDKTYYVWSTGNENKAKESSGTVSNEVVAKCPNCGGDVKKGRYGYYCTANCGASFGKVYGHELSESQVLGLLNGCGCSYKEKGKTTIVMPEMHQNAWNGKIFYNWKTRRG